MLLLGRYAARVVSPTNWRLRTWPGGLLARPPLLRRVGRVGATGNARDDYDVAGVVGSKWPPCTGALASLVACTGTGADS